jgi:aminoglycoside 6'-N-acetyltransferase I
MHAPTHAPMIRLATSGDLPAWSALRAQLWPQENAAEHAVECAQMLTDHGADALLAFDPSGRLIGFLEVSLRSDAEGCETSPVGYVEGWFVIPGLRRKGTGSALIRAGEDWARARGCTEMASDTELENIESQEAHERLGYTNMGVIVTYRRSLGVGDARPK